MMTVSICLFNVINSSNHETLAIALDISMQVAKLDRSLDQSLEWRDKLVECVVIMNQN